MFRYPTSSRCAADARNDDRVIPRLFANWSMDRSNPPSIDTFTRSVAASVDKQPGPQRTGGQSSVHLAPDKQQNHQVRNSERNLDCLNHQSSSRAEARS